MNRAQVFTLQRALLDMGFDPGPIDGKLGPLTVAALRALWGAVGAPTEEMDPNDAILVRELERDEGRVLHAYQDSLGYLTIGIGRLIDKRKGGGISHEEADYLKMNDVRRIKRELDARIPWWRGLSQVRQRAVQNMAFQLGTGDMDGSTFALIRDRKFEEASKRLRSWKWAQQTPERAERVIRMIETGET